MDKRMLEVTNYREVRNIIGKEVKTVVFSADLRSMTLTFSDGSTLESVVGVFEHQVLFLNKQ